MLLVCSEDGFLQFSKADLEDQRELQLKAWACVEGTYAGTGSVRLGSGSGCSKTLILNYESELDQEGNFHFCEVPPGSIEIRTSDGQSRTALEARAGSVTRVEL